MARNQSSMENNVTFISLSPFLITLKVVVEYAGNTIAIFWIWWTDFQYNLLKFADKAPTFSSEVTIIFIKSPKIFSSYWTKYFLTLSAWQWHDFGQFLPSISSDAAGQTSVQRRRNSNPSVDIYQVFSSSTLGCSPYHPYLLHLWCRGYAGEWNKLFMKQMML